MSISFYRTRSPNSCAARPASLWERFRGLTFEAKLEEQLRLAGAEHVAVLFDHEDREYKFTTAQRYYPAYREYFPPRDEFGDGAGYMVFDWEGERLVVPFYLLQMYTSWHEPAYYKIIAGHGDEYQEWVSNRLGEVLVDLSGTRVVLYSYDEFTRRISRAAKNNPYA